MTSIIELRKKELTTQINQLISVAQFFIVNKKRNNDAISISQYLEFNEDKLNNIENTLHTIINKFNPHSDSFATFEICIKELVGLQSDIDQLQARGESKLSNLRYLLPIKIVISIILSWIYIWIWIIYWRWLDGWRYITLIAMVWYLPCYPFLLILYYIEEGDSFDFSLFRRFFTKLLLKD
ncbi:MAG TPA: hypothetical protein VJ843_00540 [Candidatus Saccharimonadales bacterium]|nr:hypothetical protein [Candidatus Saccharimonadales bacterium]